MPVENAMPRRWRQNAIFSSFNSPISPTGNPHNPLRDFSSKNTQSWVDILKNVQVPLIISIYTHAYMHIHRHVHTDQSLKKKHRRVDRKIAEYFGALDTIVEDLGSVLSIHMTTYKQSTDLVLQAIMPYYCSHENQACTWYPKYIEAKYTKWIFIKTGKIRSKGAAVPWKTWGIINI